MKITIEVDNVELFAVALNNAIATYGDMLSSIYFNCEVPLKYEKLKAIPNLELNERFNCLVGVYKQVEEMERNYK